jgi:hypothetical protein
MEDRLQARDQNTARNLNYRNAYFAAPIAAAALLLSGCGITHKNTGRDRQPSTTTTTETVLSRGKSKTVKEKIVSNSPHYMREIILAGQQLGEYAIADIETAGLPYSGQEVDQVTQQIVKLNKKSQAFTNGENLRANRKLIIPINPNDASTFNKYLGQQIIKTTHETPASNKIDGQYFYARTSSVTRQELGKSWHKGCPVGPSQLELINMDYYGFNNKVHDDGEGDGLLVNKSVVYRMEKAMAYLFYSRFPIAEEVPLSYYGGSDMQAVKHDDTSSFNCRKAVTTRPVSWSMHAYGLATDVNDSQNPYEVSGKWYPDNSYAKDRSDYRPGMAEPLGTPNDTLTKAFASVNYYWGGDWAVGNQDFQHFSTNGH